MQRRIALSVLLVLAAGSLFALGGTEAETGDVGPAVIESLDFIQPRRMIFYFEADPNAFSPADAQYLYHSVLIAVADANKDVVILESDSQGIPLRIEDKHEVARAIEADSWLLVRAVIQGEELAFETETFDILAQEYFGQETIVLGAFLDYREPFPGNLGFGGRDYRRIIRVAVGRITRGNQCPSGTGIHGRGMPELEIGRTGSTEIILANPAIYSYEAIVDGYYPVRDLFYLGYSPLTIDIKQVRKEEMAVDFKINNFQFFGFNYYYFLEPADWYLKGGFTTYAIGIYFLENSLELARSSPLTLLRLGGGKYWGDQAATVRYYTGANVLLQFAHGSDAFGFDDNAPVALELAIGAEFVFPGKHFRIFAEYDPIIYYTFDPEVFFARSFLQSYVEEGGVVGYLELGSLILNYLKLSTGVKYSW